SGRGAGDHQQRGAPGALSPGRQASGAKRYARAVRGGHRALPRADDAPLADELLNARLIARAAAPFPSRPVPRPLPSVPAAVAETARAARALAEFLDD